MSDRKRRKKLVARAAPIIVGGGAAAAGYFLGAPGGALAALGGQMATRRIARRTGATKAEARKISKRALRGGLVGGGGGALAAGLVTGFEQKSFTAGIGGALGGRIDPLGLGRIFGTSQETAKSRQMQELYSSGMYGPQVSEGGSANRKPVESGIPGLITSYDQLGLGPDWSRGRLGKVTGGDRQPKGTATGTAPLGVPSGGGGLVLDSGAASASPEGEAPKAGGGGIAIAAAALAALLFLG